MPVRPPESLLSAILIILINGTPPRQTTNVPTPTGECSPKKGLFRHLRWRDVIVIAAGLALGVAIKFHYAHPDHPLGGRDPSDYEKWQVRPPMPRVALGEQNTVQEDTMPPCFFLRPKGANGQSATTGAVSHCLPPLPDGQNLDVFEVHLYGVVQHVKTDVYVPGSMPHAFTRLTEPLTKWSKSYQLYVSHVYEPLLSGSRLPYSFMDWRLPDGRTIHYTRISPGSGFADPVYETQSNVAPFARSRFHGMAGAGIWLSRMAPPGSRLRLITLHGRSRPR